MDTRLNRIYKFSRFLQKPIDKSPPKEYHIRNIKNVMTKTSTRTRPNPESENQRLQVLIDGAVRWNAFASRMLEDE